MQRLKMTDTTNSIAATTNTTGINPQLQQVYEILQTQNDKILQIENENKQLRQQLQQLQLNKQSNHNTVQDTVTPSNDAGEQQQQQQQQSQDNNIDHTEYTALDIWKQRVSSEHRIIQQLYAFLKSQKQTLRDIVTELQYQQNKWKNDKHKLLHKLKHNMLTTQQSKKLINALNQRKHELDNSTDALNNDITQLKSIKQWCIHKENTLNQLDQKVTKLMHSMNNQTDALQTIDSYWNQYIVEQQTTVVPTMTVHNNNNDNDTDEHKSNVQSHKHTPSFYIKHSNNHNVVSPVPHNASLESIQQLSTLDTSDNVNNGNTANHNFSVHNQTNATHHNNNSTQHLFVGGSATTGANISTLQTPKSARLLKEMLSTWISQRKLLNDSLQTRMQRLRDQPSITISSASTSPTNKSHVNPINASEDLLQKSQELKQTIASPRFPFGSQNIGMFASHSVHATPINSPTTRNKAFTYSVSNNNNSVQTNDQK